MTNEEYQRAIVTISKEKLATLPAAQNKGKVWLIDKSSKVEDAIKDLRASDILGFDTETRPSFKKGLSYSPALIQLANEKGCYLFRTNLIGYPQELIDLLEDPKVLKVGLSIHDDFHNLRKVADINPQGFIDLQPFVKNYKIADNSLSRLYGILFGERISKSQRLTNWEASELTESQQAYAALDAMACIRIYKYLAANKFDPQKSEYLIVPEEKETSEDLEETEKQNCES